MLTLILFLFYQFSQSEEQCPIKKISGLAKFAEALSKPSKSIGNKLYSSFFEEEEEEEEEDGYESEGEEEDEDIDLFSMKHLCGAIAFAAFFMFFFIILFFWTCCSQCCACYSCYRPKTSDKPSICLIVVFSISAAFLFFSIIALYLSGSKISEAFNEFVDLPHDINNSFNNFIGKITDITYGTLDTADDSFNKIKNEVDSLIIMFNTNSNDQKNNAANSQDLIEEYVQYFNISSENVGSDYKTLYNSYPNEINLKTRIQDVLEHTAPQVIDIAQKMIDNAEKLEDTAVQLDEQTASLNEVSESIGRARESIDEVVDQMDTIKDAMDEFYNITDEAADYKSLVGTLVYVIPSYCLLFLVAYVLSFIFKCCCSKCLLAWFHCLAFFVCFFVIFLGAIFAFLFGLLNNFCPEIIDFITDTVELEGISPENLTQVFVCDQTKPIMELGFDQFINVNESLEDLNEVPGKLKDITDIKDLDTLKNNFDNFTDGLDLNEAITGNQIIYNYQTTLPQLENEGDYETVKKIYNLIEEHEPTLVKARGLMNQVTSFAEQITPSINNMLDTAENLTNIAIQSFNQVDNRLRDITCIDSRCIYTSLHNPVCYTITTGAGLWAVSAVTTIIAIILMSCSICKRRKQFKIASIQPAEEFEGPDQDLAGFTANDDLLL
ncbi:hypothetical protein M9Y10_021898 [Tritrichomonas musculus]|uniref:Prominin n=1 Tax=Tritrichomonas musculus TaxID=1915356 RepID=A0ABR2KRN6_9EUKA